MVVKIDKEIGNEHFYKKAIQIVNESKVFRGAAKTPALILPSERESPERKEYCDALMKKIKGGNIKVKYLFSLPRTEEEIITGTNASGVEQWEEIRREWQELIRYKNVDLRWVDHDDFISCIIGNHHTLIGWKGLEDRKISAITYLNNEMCFYKDSFDMIFEKASNDNEKAINRIENKLKESHLI